VVPAARSAEDPFIDEVVPAAQPMAYPTNGDVVPFLGRFFKSK